MFMLKRHDDEHAGLKELAPQEIEAVFGGEETIFGDGDCGDDQTVCETLTVTPDADGGRSTDCDVG